MKEFISGSARIILPRVGTEDDNVPPLHTRKYVRILNGLMKIQPP